MIRYITVFLIYNSIRSIYLRNTNSNIYGADEELGKYDLIKKYLLI